jgi:hypothetical protein
MAYGTRVLGSRRFQKSPRTGPPSPRAQRRSSSPRAKGSRGPAGKDVKGRARRRAATCPHQHPRLRHTTGHRQGLQAPGEPDAVQGCAVSRTDGMATRGGRSAGPMTPRRTSDLDPQGRGDTSLVGKRGTAEDGDVVVLQRLSDRAKPGVCASHSPGVEPHTRREHSGHPTPVRARGATCASGTPCAMADAQRGHCRGCRGSLRRSRTFRGDGTRDGLPDASPLVTEPSEESGMGSTHAMAQGGRWTAEQRGRVRDAH